MVAFEHWKADRERNASVIYSHTKIYSSFQVSLQNQIHFPTTDGGYICTLFPLQLYYLIAWLKENSCTNFQVTSCLLGCLILEPRDHVTKPKQPQREVHVKRNQQTTPTVKPCKSAILKPKPINSSKTVSPRWALSATSLLSCKLKTKINKYKI